MFAGGTDTTATVLEWAMSELVNNAEAMTKAQLEVREVLGEDRVIITNCDIAKLPYMRMVIKEVLSYKLEKLTECSLVTGDWRVWVDYQHGEYHEGPGLEHVEQEDHEDQP